MISALLLAVLAQADVSPPPPPPPVEPVEPAGPGVPQAFFEDVLSWDPQSNQALRGKQRTVLTRTQFFETVGRVDLVDQSSARRTRRIGLAVGAVGVAIAGAIGGVVLLSGAPDMNSPYCVDNANSFNACHEKNRVHQNGGFSLIGGSLAAAMLMATLAWWSNPDVIDGDEATHLVAQYNAGLLKRLRASRGSLKWLPVVSPDGAQLAVSGRF